MKKDKNWETVVLRGEAVLLRRRSLVGTQVDRKGAYGSLGDGGLELAFS